MDGQFAGLLPTCEIKSAKRDDSSSHDSGAYYRRVGNIRTITGLEVVRTGAVFFVGTFFMLGFFVETRYFSLEDESVFRWIFLNFLEFFVGNFSEVPTNNSFSTFEFQRKTLHLSKIFNVV